MTTLTNEQKANNNDYILNQRTGNYVLKTSTIGKKIVNGVDVTPNASIRDIINAFQTHFVLKDNDVKEALKGVKLPTNIPKKFGGKAKAHTKAEGEPKRPMNAYMFYVNQTRAQVKENNPSLAPKDVVRSVAKMWKELSVQDRQPFQKLADDDKVRYQNEMKVFNPEYQVQESVDSPKRINAMILYNREHGKGAWKNASDEDKETYRNKAKELNTQNGFNGTVAN